MSKNLSVSYRINTSDQEELTVTYLWLDDHWEMVTNNPEILKKIPNADTRDEIMILLLGQHWSFELTRSDKMTDLIIAIKENAPYYVYCSLDETFYEEYDDNRDLYYRHDQKEVTKKLFNDAKQITDRLFGLAPDEIIPYLDRCHDICEIPTFPYFQILDVVRVDSERITPTDNSPTNDPTIDTSSNNGETKDGTPIGILTTSEDKIEDLVNNEVSNEIVEAIAIGREDNSKDERDDNLH